jgi:hypothetical protein
MSRGKTTEEKWRAALIGFIEECNGILIGGEARDGFGFSDPDLESIKTGSLLLIAAEKAAELASSKGHGDVFLQAQSVLEGKTSGINWKAGESDKYPALATFVACNKARRLERAEGQALEALKEYSAENREILVVPKEQDLEAYLRDRAGQTSKKTGDELRAAAEVVAQVKKELGLLPQIGGGKTVEEHFKAIEKHLDKSLANQGREEDFGFGEENGIEDEGFGDEIEEDEHEFVLSGFDKVEEVEGRLKVEEVDERSPLRELGIEAGDVITTLSVCPKGGAARDVVLGKGTLEEAIGDFKQDNTQTISMVVERQNEAGEVIYHKVTKTGGKDLEVKTVDSCPSPKEVRFNSEVQADDGTVSRLNDVIESAPEREAHQTDLEAPPEPSGLLAAIQQGMNKLTPPANREETGSLKDTLLEALGQRRRAMEGPKQNDDGEELDEGDWVEEDCEPTKLTSLIEDGPGTYLKQAAAMLIAREEGEETHAGKVEKERAATRSESQDNSR